MPSPYVPLETIPQHWFHHQTANIWGEWKKHRTHDGKGFWSHYIKINK
jgi:hypothetical protein